MLLVWLKLTVIFIVKVEYCDKLKWKWWWWITIVGLDGASKVHKNNTFCQFNEDVDIFYGCVLYFSFLVCIWLQYKRLPAWGTCCAHTVHVRDLWPNWSDTRRHSSFHWGTETKECPSAALVRRKLSPVENRSRFSGDNT